MTLDKRNGAGRERPDLYHDPELEDLMSPKPSDKDDDRQGLDEQSKSPRQKGKHKGPRKTSK